ncbi:MAG: glycosyl hydrolase, partial [Vicinamibacterales bacterium]
GRIGIDVSGADSNRLFMMFENADGGLFRSDDGGATWTRVSDDRRLRQRAFYYSHVTADTKNRETVYVLNTGFYKSTDAGKTFSTIRVPHGDNHDLWVDPNEPKRMVNANDGGGNVSLNGGETWTDQDFATAQFYHVATTKDFPYHVCGAQQDNSTACVSSQPPRGRESATLYPVGGGESGYVAPHPINRDIFYAGNQGAQITRFDRRTGHIRDIQPYPRFFSGEPAASLPERWQWTFPIVVSPHDSNVLYICSQHVWRTTNEGQTWEKISPDLTRADPKTLGHSGGPITGDMNGPEIFATVFALAPSKLEPGTIWAGSDDGLIHVTRDGGKSWQNVTPKDLPEFARVSIIDASAHSPGTATLAAKRYLVDDRAPYIYRTDDFGKTWTRIVAGIRSNDYVHVVREDPKRAGLLYAGAEHGTYVSFDAGVRWQSLSLNLPDTQISDLVVEGNDLVIATHGRSFWILDDVTALRQLTRETTDAPFHVYEPAEATRSAGPATIHYVLKQPAQKVTVEILDPRGQVIRSFTGVREAELKPAPEEPAGGGGGGVGPPQPQTLLTNAGLTRFTWDLRYRGHSTFPGMILWSAASQGPVAVPGAYQVRVTADGTSQTRPLTVRKHPGFAQVSQADLDAQLALALQIRDRTSEANDAVVRIREAKPKIKDAALVAKLSAIEEELYQVRNRSSQDPLNFPIKLNNRLASLRRVVETGDARPTDGAYHVFKELSSELDRHLASLNTLLGQVKTSTAGSR